MGGGAYGIAKRRNLGQWKFSLGVSQTGESAGPKAQSAASSLVQGDVSVPLVLCRVCVGTAEGRSASTHVRCRGLRAVERGGWVPPYPPLSAPWHLWPRQRDSARVMTLVSRRPPSLGGESPQVRSCLPWYSTQDRAAPDWGSPFTAIPVPWSLLPGVLPLCRLHTWFSAGSRHLSAGAAPCCPMASCTHWADCNGQEPDATRILTGELPP